MNFSTKIILVFSIFLASVMLYLYYKHYIESAANINFENVIKVFKQSKQMSNLNLLNIVKIRKEPHDFVKGVLRFDGKSVDMFLHGKHDVISNIILLHGMWESHWINQFITYLKANPGIQFIDVGCNMGVYTLVAAVLGHKVIAIDANKNNTDRLAQSVLVNNLIDKVTIVLNALSNERKMFSMDRVAGNIGAQMVRDNPSGSYQVKSIFLDDLLPLLDNKHDVVMKMDIERHEVQAMKAASILFDKTNIKLIQMEWAGVQMSPECYTLMGFLLSRNYTAHKDFYSKEELPRSNYQAWPFDVVWRRN